MTLDLAERLVATCMNQYMTETCLGTSKRELPVTPKACMLSLVWQSHAAPNEAVPEEAPYVQEVNVCRSAYIKGELSVDESMSQEFYASMNLHPRQKSHINHAA